jgi:hypothetical protein
MKQCGRGYQQHMMQRPHQQIRMQPPPVQIRSCILARLVIRSPIGMGCHVRRAPTFFRAWSNNVSTSRGTGLPVSRQGSTSQPVTIPFLHTARTRLRQQPPFTNPISILWFPLAMRARSRTASEVSGSNSGCRISTFNGVVNAPNARDFFGDVGMITSLCCFVENRRGARARPFSSHGADYGSARSANASAGCEDDHRRKVTPGQWVGCKSNWTNWAPHDDDRRVCRVVADALESPHHGLCILCDGEP